jgi:cell division protein FtsB
MADKLKNIFIFLFNILMQNKKWWLAPIFIVVIALNFVFSEHGIINRISLEYDKKALLEKIQIENKIGDSLKIRIKSLKYDSLEIERLAREYYGMLKPGERLYIFMPKDSVTE